MFFWLSNWFFQGGSTQCSPPAKKGLIDLLNFLKSGLWLTANVLHSISHNYTGSATKYDLLKVYCFSLVFSDRPITQLLHGCYLNVRRVLDSLICADSKTVQVEADVHFSTIYISMFWPLLSALCTWSWILVYWGWLLLQLLQLSFAPGYKKGISEILWAVDCTPFNGYYEPASSHCCPIIVW